VDTGGGLCGNLDFLGVSSFISEYFRSSSEPGHTPAVQFQFYPDHTLAVHEVYTHLTSFIRFRATGRE
jgi:hypothetical protein